MVNITYNSTTASVNISRVDGTFSTDIFCEKLFTNNFYDSMSSILPKCHTLCQYVIKMIIGMVIVHKILLTIYELNK